MATERDSHWRIQRTVLGGQTLSEEPNQTPFSIFSADLLHFILKLLNIDIFIYVYFLYLFSRLGRPNRPLYGFGKSHGPKCPPGSASGDS